METCDLQHQAMATRLLEEVFACSNNLPTVPQAQAQQQPQQERRPRPPQEQALRCPRCDSTNTKFCYYNNYSLSQPRYFCKGCRRYWTKGGTLRNVPVGGGCRKNKRPPSSSAKKAQDQTLAACTNAVLQSLPPPPPLTYDPSDLTLAFAGLQKPLPTTGQLGLDDRDPLMLDSSGANPIVPGFLDILRSGFLDSSSTGTFNNLYYGLCGHGNTQQVEGGVGGEQVVPPFEGVGGATAVVKHESSYKSVGGDNKLFMGLQWQVGGDGNMMVDPAGRDYWNGVGSSWHGLLYSSLI